MMEEKALNGKGLTTATLNKQASRRLRVLVACEESQAVCIEFRKLGHEAYSCDIIECSGGHPEWHIRVDALQLLKMEWDLVIAFPPCTHLAVSGARHFERKRNDGRQKDAIEFFCKFLDSKCQRIAIENPVGIISGDYVRKWFPDIANNYNLPRACTQTIQPWMFGDPYEKKTCLWLKNLPKLEPTKIVEPPARQVVKSGKTLPYWYSHCGSGAERSKARSKTFPGIADAMAKQWSEYILYQERQMDIFDYIER